MPLSSKSFLANYLRTISDDAVFVLASTHKMDHETLVELATRRGSHYAALIKGEKPDSSQWDSWLVNMCVALAPLAPPVWLPMHELIDSLTLETGARGVRSLFTSKPSDKQVGRTRQVGAFAIRTLSCVLGADEMSDDDQLLLRCVAASLGLPEEEANKLSAEAPRNLDAIDVPFEFDPKLAKRVASGIWRAAFRDGLDPREDQLGLDLCQKMGLNSEDTESLRKRARAEVDARKTLGAAAVDALRYILADDDVMGPRLARLLAYLALPPVHRVEPLAAIKHGGPIVLAKRHALDKKQREICLAVVWFAVLGTNPNQTRLAELTVRHDRVASDIGSQGEGSAARAATSSFIHEQLCSAVQAGGL